MKWFKKWLKHKSIKASRQSKTFQPALETLEERQVPTVLYYGGNVLPKVEAQALFLGNQWSTSANSALKASVDSFVSDVTGSAYMTALQNAGYGVGPGSAKAGYVDTTTPVSTGTVITDSFIQNTVKANIAAGHLQAIDANSLYIVYVEPNVAINLGAGQGTTQQGILGYHGAFAGPGGTTIRYAVIAYPGGNIGNSSLGTSAQDQLTSVTSHELAEAVTDPDVNFARLGWYDPRRGEIGDITENNPNALVRLDGYLVQEAATQNDQLLAIPTSPTTPNPPPNNPPPATTVATTTSLTAGQVTSFGRRRSISTVTLTVKITPASGAVLPDGTIELIYNGSVLGTATVRWINGVAMAQFNVQFSGHGTFDFSAQYTGSSSFQGSTSNSLSVTV